MDPKEQFLRQVSIVIKTAGILILVAFGGFLFWNPFIMIPGLLLGFVVIRLGRAAVKSVWHELTKYSTSATDYWGATILCAIIGLCGVVGLVGAISIINQAFIYRL